MKKINILKRKKIIDSDILLYFAVIENNGRIIGYCLWKKNGKKHIDKRIFGFLDENINEHIDNWVEEICEQIGIEEIPEWQFDTANKLVNAAKSILEI